ncbi:MAG: membrane protein [Bacteroidetes bacterium 4572_114]|nr:MAG: membrane protein [Bacteroidetes bacterium 4572_114]
MSFVTKEKIFTKEWFKVYSLIIVGTFVMASGFVFFINPYKIVPGGVYGIAIVIHYLTEGVFSFWPTGIPIGMLGLSMDIPLTLLGIKILGPRFGVKTVVGFVFTAFFIDLLTWFVGQDDPLKLGDQVLLASIFGGVMIGFGLGLIFRSRATSGGSDIIAMIIKKYTGMPLGQLMIAVDSAIVLVGLAAFGDWEIPLYSWIVIFITGKVIDITMRGISYEKTMFIISDRYKEISRKIIVDLNRGGTVFTGKGMYNEAEKNIIYTNVSRREYQILKDYIRQLDPNAFVTILDANEVLGNGFKSLRED